MRNWILIATPALLVLQAALVGLPGNFEHPPPAPELSRLPDPGGDWIKNAELELDPKVEGQLGADRWLSRVYMNSRTGIAANLFVAWFQSQRGGATQPHSPKVCLPGSGWVPEQTGEIRLATAAGTIPVNRYLIANRGQKAVVLYWYQTPRRVLAGEWESKLWLIPDALRDHRTDAALVRVMVWRADDAGVTAATDLAQRLYPSLHTLLPRVESQD